MRTPVFCGGVIIGALLNEQYAWTILLLLVAVTVLAYKDLKE